MAIPFAEVALNTIMDNLKNENDLKGTAGVLGTHHRINTIKGDFMAIERSNYKSLHMLAIPNDSHLNYKTLTLFATSKTLIALCFKLRLIV